MSPKVNRPEVKEVRTFVDKQHDFVVCGRAGRSTPGDSNQVAIVSEHDHDRLSLWAPVVGECQASAGYALEQIPCLRRIDVSRNPLHVAPNKLSPDKPGYEIALRRDFMAAWAASIPVIMAPVNPPVPP